MAKQKKKVSRKARQVGKRSSEYTRRLKLLREITSNFDAKRFAQAYDRKPSKQRTRDLRHVSEQYRRLKPWLVRTQKVFSSRSKRNLEELRKVAGFPRIKGLRGVPIETAKPDRTRVTFDKRGRPTIKTAGTQWKIFRFPRLPRDGWHTHEGKRVFRTAADDATFLMSELQKTLPAGVYVVMTRHHFLLHGSIERDALTSEIKALAEEYNRRAPGFARLIYGVKWIGRGDEAAEKRRRGELSEREARKIERKRIKNEKAAREIARMHKILTGQTLDKELLAAHRDKRSRSRASASMRRVRAKGRL